MPPPERGQPRAGGIAAGPGLALRKPCLGHAGFGAGFDEERILVAAYPAQGLGLHGALGFETSFGQPDNLLGDLQVDEGALHRLGKVEPGKAC